MLNDDFGAHIKRPVKTELSTGAEWELTMVPYTDAPPTWVVKRLRLVPGLVEFELVGDVGSEHSYRGAQAETTSGFPTGLAARPAASLARLSEMSSSSRLSLSIGLGTAHPITV